MHNIDNAIRQFIRELKKLHKIPSCSYLGGGINSKSSSRRTVWSKSTWSRNLKDPHFIESILREINISINKTKDRYALRSLRIGKKYFDNLKIVYRIDFSKPKYLAIHKLYMRIGFGIVKLKQIEKKLTNSKKAYIADLLIPTKGLIKTLEDISNEIIKVYSSQKTEFRNQSNIYEFAKRFEY